MQQDATSNYAGVWDRRIGFGRRPALIMIDMVQAYTAESSPLYAAGAVAALPHAGRLLTHARKCGLPVIHTTILYQGPDCVDGGVWVKKAPVMKMMVSGNPQAAFCEEVQPLKSELVVTKQYASAFFGTSLAATLSTLNIDTIVLAGFSTSGCVRATAVDGLQYGYRVIVARDAVGDRHPDPHEANLFDIDRKYGDVLSLDPLLDEISRHAAP